MIHHALQSAIPLREHPPSDVPPVVSVSMLSYNGAPYLGRAIESVLDQVVDFPCELLIGDDCSSDGSQEILRDYQRRYPHLIQLVLHPRRYEGEIPGRTNNVTNLNSVRGEFTAMLDGDDYWTDPLKLSRQVHQMRADASLSICCHQSRIVCGEGVTSRLDQMLYTSFVGTQLPTGTYGPEVLRDTFTFPWHISASLFRTALLRPLPDWFSTILAADRAIVYILSQRGRIYYDDAPASVWFKGEHNFTQSSTYHSLEYLYLKLNDERIFARHFPRIRTPIYSYRYRSRVHFQIAKWLAVHGEYVKAAWRLRLVDPRLIASRGWRRILRG